MSSFFGQHTYEHFPEGGNHNIATNDPLSILLWNINGARNRSHELCSMLNEFSRSGNAVDVVLLSETRLTPSKSFSIFGYNIYRTDHPYGNPHGGTAVLVRDDVPHQDPLYSDSNRMQSTSLSINTPTPLTVSAIYCSPNQPISAFEFYEYFHSLRPLAPSFIVGGDYNCKHYHWGSRKSNKRGRELFNTITSLELATVSSGEYTYWPTDPNRSPDVLDFFITNSHDLLDDCKLDNLVGHFSSDHSPILLTVFPQSVPQRLPSYSYQYY